MIVVARSSDRTRERRWHFAVVSLAGAVGLYLSTVWGNNVPLAMVALSVGTAGMLATMKEVEKFGLTPEGLRPRFERYLAEYDIEPEG